MKNIENFNLKVLIYDLYNVIIVENKNSLENIVDNVRRVTINDNVSGWVFRKAFGTKKRLTKEAYTQEDYEAIFAQYSLTYGWSHIFEFVTGKDAENVLCDYGIDAKIDIPTEKAKSIEELKKRNIKIETYDFVEKKIKEFATSKVVLRENQAYIIKATPVSILEKVYKEEKFVINDTEVLFIQAIISNGGQIYFKNADQIARYVFSLTKEDGEKITTKALKTSIIKLKTREKKMILKSIEKNRNITVKDMHKYKDYWKKIFTQLKFAPVERMKKRFVRAYILKDALYSNKYTKYNTEIEELKKDKRYDDAFFIEMLNPGQFVRHLMEYMRYAKDDSLFECEELVFALSKVNVKILYQFLIMLKTAKWEKVMYERKVFGYSRHYKDGLKEISKKRIKTIKKTIKKAIKAKKKEENRDIGKVFISKEVENIAIQTSGNADESIAKSGFYLTPGSKINLNKFEKDDAFVRFGVAWRGESSCDIDLSTVTNNNKRIYYGNPEYNFKNKIVMASSGDITWCKSDVFSIEYIDVDLKEIRKTKTKRFISEIRMFSGKEFKNYEVYGFIKIIQKDDRKVVETIDLKDCDYAVRITGNNKSTRMFYVDIEENTVKIINDNDTFNDSSTVEILEDDEFDAYNKYIMLNEALNLSISKEQITEEPNEADIIIGSSDDFIDEKENIDIYRDLDRINSIIF